MPDLWHGESELIENLGPLFALQRSIYDYTALNPTAVMLPLSVLPKTERLFDLPVIRGDRFALVYEPPSMNPRK